MKLDQKGIALLGGLIFLAVISLVGGTGFYVYNTNNGPNQPLSVTPAKKTNKAVTAQATTSTTIKPIDNKNPGFVTIKEWGVAVRIGSVSNADKLTYRMAKDEHGDDTVYFTIKNVPENCRNVGFALHRKTIGESEKYVKIGNGFYAPSAAPLSLCDKSPGEEKTSELLTQLGESLDKLDFEVKVSN
jgi:hypothetical protein